jgi:hypothetical protein
MQSSEVTADPNVKPDMILRRYMDLPKLLDLLLTRRLYLRRADGFPDRFEGALTPIFRHAMDEAHKQGKTKDNAEYFYRRSRMGNFVSCWTIGAKDNMALWQLYGGVKTSVVVTSTVEKLILVAMSWPERTLLHRVRYIDHSKNPDMVIGDYTEMLRYKNESYSYENELRIIVPRQGRNWKNNPLGIRLPVPQLSDLVRSIVVAPEAEDWFFDAVQDLCEKYHLQVPVRRSKLAYMTV